MSTNSIEFYKKLAIERDLNESILSLAIANDDLTTIISLMKEHRNDDNYIASSEGNNDYIAYIRDDNNLTPLDMLTFMNIDVVRYFVENNFDITKSVNFIMKKQYYNTEVCLYLLDTKILPINVNTIENIIIANNYELLKKVIEKYNYKCINNTILIRAILNGNLAIVKLVIDNGGLTIINSSYSKHLLLIACETLSNNVNSINENEYINNTNSYSKQNEYINNVNSYSKQNEYFDIVRYLVENCCIKIDVDILKKVNNLPNNEINNKLIKYLYDYRVFTMSKDILFTACRVGDLYTVRMLIERNKIDININDVDEHITKPLEYALMSNNYDLINYIIKHTNCDKHCMNIYKVIKSGNLKLTKEYVKYINVCDYNYVIEAAIDSGNINILRYLVEQLNVSLYPSSLEYSAYKNNYKAFSYVYDTIGINNGSYEMLIKLAFHGNIDIVKFIDSRYKLTQNDYLKMLKYLVFSSNNTNHSNQNMYIDTYIYIYRRLKDIIDSNSKVVNSKEANNKDVNKNSKHNDKNKDVSDKINNSKVANNKVGNIFISLIFDAVHYNNMAIADFIINDMKYNIFTTVSEYDIDSNNTNNDIDNNNTDGKTTNNYVVSDVIVSHETLYSAIADKGMYYLIAKYK